MANFVISKTQNAAKTLNENKCSNFVISKFVIGRIYRSLIAKFDCTIKPGDDDNSEARYPVAKRHAVPTLVGL